jgi:hypothetical protein
LKTARLALMDTSNSRILSEEADLRPSLSQVIEARSTVSREVLPEERLARTKEYAQTVMRNLGGTHLNFWNLAK